MATSTISSLYSGASGSNSVGGPLDVQWIVDQIITSKKESQLSPLEDFQAFYEAKKSSYQELNLMASSLESSLYAIRASFSAKTATVSDSDYLSLSASSTAQTGTFNVIVGQLARTQSNSSTTFASSTEQLLADGTTFTVTQNGVDKSIEISGENRSLNGLKNSINALGLDISAAVIFDGSSYRLQVTGKETGTENSFTIDDTAVGTSMATPTLEARDAEIYVNTPVDDSYKITRSSNTFNDVISGLTINLREADVSKTVTVEVSQDTSAVSEKIQDFVAKFNEISAYVNAQFEYDEESGAAGALSGESMARQVQLQLLSKVSSRIEGISQGASYKSIANIGLTLSREGLLEVDAAKLDEALRDDVDAVKRIFVDLGTSENGNLSYIGKSSQTKAGEYEVIITQAAEQAVVTAGTEAAAAIAQDEVLTFTYNGSEFEIDLTSGMTISQVVSTVNSYFSDNGIGLTASSSGNYLRIATESYGSAASFSVVSNVASGGGGTGIGTTKLSDTGVDVAGTIGGSAATGSGQVLTSDAGDSNGLSVFVNSTTLGSQGSLYLTLSPLEDLRQTMYDITLPYDGLIAKSIDALDQQLENIDEKISAINTQLSQEADLLISQFTKANEALVQLQYLQSSLSNSLTGWKG